MSLITENLVLDHDYTKGTAKDLSGNSNDGTVTAGEVFKKGQPGWGFQPQSTAARITVTDDASLQLTQGTFVISGDFPNPFGTNEDWIDKRDAGGTNYILFATTSTTIDLNVGVTTTFTLAEADYVGAKSLIVTKASGASTAKLYIDGSFHSNSVGSVTMTADDADLRLGNTYLGNLGDSFVSDVNSILIYSDEKTATEVAQIHKAVITRKTPFVGKRNFQTAPSVGVPASGSAWNMQIVDDKLVDQGGNLVATQIGDNNNVTTPWGEPAVEINGTDTSGFSASSTTDFDFADNPWGVFLWMKTDTTASAFRVMLQNGLINTDGFMLQKNGSNQVVFTLMDPGGNAEVISTKTMIDDNYHLIAGFSEGSAGSMYVYMDGEEDATTASAQALVASTSSFRIGDYQASSRNWLGSFGPFPAIRQFTDKADFEAQLKKEWNRVANKVVYKETFEDAHIMQAAITAGQLPGTEYSVNSVSGQIVDGPNLGEKSITGAAAGAIVETPMVNHAFGRYVIDYEAVAGSRCRHSLIEGAVFSIADFGGTNSTISMIPSAGGGMTGTVGALTAGHHQAIIDKKANKATLNTTLYNDGVLITAATGSNPYTDRTNITDGGLRQLAPYNTAKIHSVFQLFGVPLP